MSRVSVLVPCFNTRLYIRDCLTSILKQSYRDFEIVVVDDGSSDGTADVVEDMMSGQPIILVRAKHGGCAAALKTAIDAASSDVLTFVGSDDTLLPNSLAVGVAPFVDPQVGYVWTNWRWLSTTRTGIGWSSPLPPGNTLWSAICKCGWWKACCQMFWSTSWYRKSRGLDISIPSAVDYQVAVLLGETGCKTVHIPTPTYLYRHPRPGSMSTDGRAKQKRCDQLIRERSIEYMKGRAGG